MHLFKSFVCDMPVSRRGSKGGQGVMVDGVKGGKTAMGLVVIGVDGGKGGSVGEGA